MACLQSISVSYWKSRPVMKRRIRQWWLQTAERLKPCINLDWTKNFENTLTIRILNSQTIKHVIKRKIDMTVLNMPLSLTFFRGLLQTLQKFKLYLQNKIKLASKNIRFYFLSIRIRIRLSYRQDIKSDWLKRKQHILDFMTFHKMSNLSGIGDALLIFKNPGQMTREFQSTQSNMLFFRFGLPEINLKATM